MIFGNNKNIAVAVFGTDYAELSETEYMSEFIPEYRVKKSERYRKFSDRVNCIVSYFLLYRILKNNFGISEIPEICFNDYGKPFFINEKIYFSISHCDGAVCCCVSECDVGTDIQDKIYSYEDIAESVLSENELGLLHGSDVPAETFTELWTFKESYLKFKGTGITDSLSDIDFLSFRKKEKICFSTVWKNNFCISSCSEKELSHYFLTMNELLNN